MTKFDSKSLFLYQNQLFMGNFLALYHRVIGITLAVLLIGSLIGLTYVLFQKNELLKLNFQLENKLRIADGKIKVIDSLMLSTSLSSEKFSLQHTIISKDEKIELLNNHNLDVLDQLRAINSYISSGRQPTSDSTCCVE